jgi:hypothetical protein
MKTLLFRTALGFAGTLLAGIALPLTSRGQEPVKTTFVTPATPAELEIQAIGEAAIDRLAVSMMNEVKSALNGLSPEEALDMCHLKGLPSSGPPIRSMPRITAVKFTSLKIRQSDNAPDAADKVALEYVDHAIAIGDAPPKVLVQKVEAPDSPVVWRVYKPIGLTSNCLACHGDREDMSPKLRQRLKSVYPDDQATGYRARDWRGFIRVNVSEVSSP